MNFVRPRCWNMELEGAILTYRLQRGKDFMKSSDWNLHQLTCCEYLFSKQKLRQWKTRIFILSIFAVHTSGRFLKELGNDNPTISTPGSSENYQLQRFIFYHTGKGCIIRGWYMIPNSSRLSAIALKRKEARPWGCKHSQVWTFPILSLHFAPR